MTNEEKLKAALDALPGVRERCAAAKRMVSGLCDGKRRWIMSVPARPTEDPDLVITDSLKDLPLLADGLEAAAAVLAEERAVSNRLFDLVRYKRMDLFTDGLISEDEYALLMTDPQASGSVQRLETYDELRERIAELEAKLAEARKALDLCEIALDVSNEWCECGHPACKTCEATNAKKTALAATRPLTRAALDAAKGGQ